jgi:hypothetical protein
MQISTSNQTTNYILLLSSKHHEIGFGFLLDASEKKVQYINVILVD